MDVSCRFAPVEHVFYLLWSRYFNDDALSNKLLLLL